MFRRADPFFYAFDVLWLNGEDLRSRPLLQRKRLSRKLIGRGDRIRYADHVERNGSGLFEQACEWDLEGIVAKWKDGWYIADNKRSTWIKIKNPQYTQAEGHDELFERRLL
jgi:bifunctional non-homologous end joining protein LigD